MESSLAAPGDQPVASPARVAAPEETCPAVKDPEGWFDLGNAAPAPDGTRARAAASGGGLVTSPALGGAAVAFDPDMRPVVAYVLNQGVHVRRLDSGRWQPVGNLDAELGVRAVGAVGNKAARLRDGFGMSAPAIAADAKGELVVAWIDRAPPWNSRLRAARWRAGAWQDASPRTGPQLGCARWSGEFGDMSEMPQIHVGPAGDIWVACMQPVVIQARSRSKVMVMPSPGPIARPALQVRRWTGRTWQQLPDVWLGAKGTMSEVTGSHGIVLAADAQGALVLHAARDTAGTRWQALRWSAARRAWKTTPLSAPDGASLLGLAAVRAGSPAALWLRGDMIEVRDVSATSDQILARVPVPAGLRPGPTASQYLGSMAMGERGQLAVLGHAQIPVEYVPQILYVHVWNGTAWVDDGATRWTGGVSQSPGASRAPAIALDRCGLPVVAWLEAHAQGSDVYLRRFTGQAWAEIESSATGGGVSKSGRALEPAVAVDAEGRIVASWWEQTADARGLRATLRVRRLVGDRWRDVGHAPVLEGVQPIAGRAVLWARDPERLVVAVPEIQRGQVVVMRWDGERWTHELLATGYSNAAILYWPEIDEKGRVHVLFLDPAGSPLHVAAWQGSWKALRSVARAAMAPAQAAARLDASGRVYLAWVGSRTWPGPADVHVEIEDAQGMVALPGTASDSEAHSMDPAIAVGARVCVAWSEPDQADSEIFVRCQKRQP